MINNLPELEILEKNLGVQFKKKELLANALTHRSYLNEIKKEEMTSNERMEFLGDSVLAFWVSGTIYLKFSSFPEGKLTFIRTHLVRTETLAGLAKKLDLGRFMLMSKGEEMGKGRENPLLLANCFEAVLGAVYLDQGIETASEYLKRQFETLLAEIKDAESLKDSKSLLQETVQAKGSFSPVYKLVSAVGPDHAKTFTMGVYVNDEFLAEGTGDSKQQAEEAAAATALKNLH